MIRAVVDSISNLISTLFFLVVVFVPLGLWKMVDIIIWIYQHIRIGLV